MFRGYFFRMMSHVIHSINMPFNIVVVVLCVGVGFGIAVISSFLQGDPMQRAAKPPIVGIPGLPGGLTEYQGELATQALQYVSAAGDPEKQEEIKENIKAQYGKMDEKNKAQLKKLIKEKYPDKIEEIKKKAKEAGLQ